MDLRTIHGHSSRVRRLLDACFAATGLSAFHLLNDAVRGPTAISPPQDSLLFRIRDETWHGYFRCFLAPSRNGARKAWSLPARLELLKASPENVGHPRRTRSLDDVIRIFDLADWCFTCTSLKPRKLGGPTSALVTAGSG